jgi:hypothetical protein
LLDFGSSAIFWWLKLTKKRYYSKGRQFKKGDQEFQMTGLAVVFTAEAQRAQRGRRDLIREPALPSKMLR